MTIDDWHWIRGVNLDGVVHCCHTFGPALVEQGRGHVVNVSSALAYTMRATEPAYVTTKAAVLALSRCLRADWRRSGVGVTAVCPGVINTAIVDDAYLDGEFKGKRTQIKSFYERFGSSPDVVAEAVVDAVRRKKMIRTVPRHHVALNWALRRLSPRAAQPLARASSRFISGRK
jgi:short-subunit dehydrogenase